VGISIWDERDSQVGGLAVAIAPFYHSLGLSWLVEGWQPCGWIFSTSDGTLWTEGYCDAGREKDREREREKERSLQ
jgi:hypothetical protein